MIDGIRAPRPPRSRFLELRVAYDVRSIAGDGDFFVLLPWRRSSIRRKGSLTYRQAMRALKARRGIRGYRNVTLVFVYERAR